MADGETVEQAVPVLEVALPYPDNLQVQQQRAVLTLTVSPIVRIAVAELLPTREQRQ